MPRGLKFEGDIAKTSSVINKDTIPNSPTGHANASGAFRANIYQKGRYDQTEGNAFGDVSDATPTCPYHMPRNIRRYENPRLHVPRKNAGDIIEAKDINNLIDKIRLYNQVWEAEANNIYGYPAVSGRANVPVNISKLNYINASTKDSNSVINQPNEDIIDASRSSRDIVIPKLPVIYTFSAGTQAEVRAKLAWALANKVSNLTSTDYNVNSFGLNPNGFPEEVVGFNGDDALTYYDGTNTKLLNGGFTNQVATEFVHDGLNMETYHLVYTSGKNKGSTVTGSDGRPLIFNTDKIYVQSWIPSDEATSTNYGDKQITSSTLESRDRFCGFVLYWVNQILAQNIEPEAVTEIVNESPSFGIGAFGMVDEGGITNYSATSDNMMGELIHAKLSNFNPLESSGGCTQDLSINIRKFLNNMRGTALGVLGAYADGMEDITGLRDYPCVTFWFDLYSRMPNFAGKYLAEASKIEETYRYFIKQIDDVWGGNDTIRIPKQRIYGDKCYRLEGSNWVEQSFVYSIFNIEFVISNPNPELSDEKYNPLISILIHVSAYNPRDKKVYAQTIHNIDFPEGKLLDTAHWYEIYPWHCAKDVSRDLIYRKSVYNPGLMNNPLAFFESNSGRFKLITGVVDGFCYPMNNFFCQFYGWYHGSSDSYIDTLSFIRFSNSGNIPVNNSIISAWNSMRNISWTWIDMNGTQHESPTYTARTDWHHTLDSTQMRRWYTSGLACPDGSAPDSSGTCTYTKTYTLGYNDIVVGETSTTLLVREKYFTYTKNFYTPGNSIYPVIKGIDYSVIRNVLNSYIQSIMILAQTGINNGTSDTQTIQDIAAFQVSQAQQSTTFNPDDPDTSFYGYHAITNGIIKLDFYNTLVDAYKLIINSCICNADCACNLVCACNINCGCNY